jgi:glycosyltransferase involved in cell wall biosynthesis
MRPVSLASLAGSTRRSARDKMAKHLRIAFFTPSFLPKCSGAEIFHHNLATRLVERGHRVSIVLPRRYIGELSSLAVNFNYDLISYPANTWSYFKRSVRFALLMNRLTLARLQERYQFDLWHGVVTYPTGVCLVNWQQHASKNRRPTPYLVRSVGDDVLLSGEEVGLRRDPRVEKLIRAAMPEVRMMIALSETMRREYRKIGVPEENLTIIPNAVDLSRFRAPFKREQTRPVHGLATDRFVFLAVGRNHPQKDYPTMLDAALQLHRTQGAPFHLVIAGRDVRGLEAEVGRRGLQDVVRLLEIGISKSTSFDASALELPSAEMIALYRSADAFVMTSLLEGFSSALLEAMAAALPVIVTDSPGCADFVREEDSGWIVPPGNATLLAERMAAILQNPQARTELADRSSRRASQFDWPMVVDRYLDLYGKLVGTTKLSRALRSELKSE